MEKGYLCLVLHAHLPFIRHPEYKTFLEEGWLYEAMIESYIPLLYYYEKLVNNSVDFRITMSLTPTLCEMLGDPLLQKRFLERLNQLQELAEKELVRTQKSTFYKTAVMYHQKLQTAREIFVNRYQMNLLTGFKHFQELGKLELITCSATHSFMPLMLHPNAINAQIETAVKNYKKHFEKSPKGIWNAECAYSLGLEKTLKKWGLNYFFVDTHGILYADKRPKYGVFAPLYCNNKTAVFGRDAESSKQVWSAEEGYPGDCDYREFYRDIGFDLPMEYIAPYLLADGIRSMTTFKYYRITGKNNEKEPYQPEWASNKAKSHAANFRFKREKQIEYLSSILDREPIIVAPYDAELFGHWWYEGPDFIYHLCKEISGSSHLKMITPSEYLKKYPVNQVSTPAVSSWGHKGYMEVWLNPSNEWICQHLHECSSIMVDLANRFSKEENTLKRRALNQMARELMLAQTSCWAFIITNHTAAEFAAKEFKSHIKRFVELSQMLENSSSIDEPYLKECELRDNIFAEMDYLVYSDEHQNTGKQKK